jgi:hypothetical protein
MCIYSTDIQARRVGETRRRSTAAIWQHAGPALYGPRHLLHDSQSFLRPVFCQLSSSRGSIEPEFSSPQYFFIPPSRALHVTYALLECVRLESLLERADKVKTNRVSRGPPTDCWAPGKRDNSQARPAPPVICSLVTLCLVYMWACLLFSISTVQTHTHTHTHSHAARNPITLGWRNPRVIYSPSS